MDKKEYIDQEMQKLLSFWFSFALLGGVFFSIVLSGLDYLVARDNFSKFLLYRLTGSSLLIIILLLSRKFSENKRVFNVLILLAVVTASYTVELIILSLGGHRSFYYAGVILILIFALAFIPLYFRMSLLVVAIIYSIYIFPILLTDSITDPRTFISNNAFLLATAASCLLWRAYNQKSLIDKLETQYELDDQRSQLKQYSSVLEDLVEERAAALQQSAKMLETLFGDANDGISIREADGTIVDVNQKFCEIHDYEKNELTGMNMRSLILEKNKPLFEERQKRLLKGESLLFETEHRRKDGNNVSLEVSTKAIDIDGRILVHSFYRDITEKKKLEAQLLHFQKMQSITTLAEGIAHEFKNTLTVVLSFTDVILQDKTLSPDTASYIGIIIKSAKDASNTVSQLLAFARKDSFENVPMDINTVVEDTLVMVSKFISKNIVIKKELDEFIPYVVGDMVQMQQVFMNLLLNAKDAMPDGGEIAIDSKMIDIKKGSLNIPATVRTGKYAHITISDTGAGIAKEHMRHIFEPFFTTKGRGKGTGLGLAIVYGVVKQHGGYITVDSIAGKGTVFNLYLPVSKKKIVKIGTEEITQFKGPETILVVDDEIYVMEPIRDVLMTNGFNVIVYTSPIQCLEFFEKNAATVDMVITDIFMPEMDGVQLINNIRAIKPEVRIVVITGFDVDLKEVSVDGLLKKPFDVSGLALMVEDLFET